MTTFEHDEYIQVYHRYNDFEQLYKILKRNYDSVIIPMLPEKNTFKNDLDVTSNRIDQLSKWLKSVATHKELKNDILLDFFFRQNGDSPEFKKIIEDETLIKKNSSSGNLDLTTKAYNMFEKVRV